MSILIFDSTPLIYLGKAELLVHLKDLEHEMLIPMSIHEDVVIRGKQKGALDALRIEEVVRDGILKVQDVEQGEMHSGLAGNESLSRSDPDVIELAFSKGGIALIDESHGRAVCEIENIKHRGSPWISRELLLEGVITKKDARASLDRMVDGGWFCSTRLYSRALDLFL